MTGSSQLLDVRMLGGTAIEWTKRNADRVSNKLIPPDKFFRFQLTCVPLYALLHWFWKQTHGRDYDSNDEFPWQQKFGRSCSSKSLTNAPLNALPSTG